MLGWNPKHAPGKHERQGEPSAGAGKHARKPETTDVILRWPNGAIMERQTRAMRQGK